MRIMRILFYLLFVVYGGLIVFFGGILADRQHWLLGVMSALFSSPVYLLYPIVSFIGPSDMEGLALLMIFPIMLLFWGGLAWLSTRGQKKAVKIALSLLLLHYISPFIYLLMEWDHADFKQRMDPELWPNLLIMACVYLAGQLFLLMVLFKGNQVQNGNRSIVIKSQQKSA